MPAVLDPQAAYELWSETYHASAHNPLMRTEQQVVERLLASISARRALDGGTGSGRYLPVLAATGAKVFGIDRSAAMLAHAAGAVSRADARALPFKRSTFQLVNASLMVGDIGDLAGWAAEMARVLAPRGHLVYSDFHPTWSDHGWQRTFRDGRGSTHVVAFEPHSIDDHLDALGRAGFSIRAIREPRLRIGRRELPVLAVFHGVKEDAGAR